MGIIGIIIIILIAYLLSNNKRKINIRTVVLGFIIQILFAIFVLVIPLGKSIIGTLATGVDSLFAQGRVGLEFVFGELANGKSFIFAIFVLGNMIFFAALISLLYYLKIMPFIINSLGSLLSYLLKTSKPESISSIATMFLGPGEAQLTIKPFFPHVTKSELFTIMTAGLTSISGSVLGGYIALGMPSKYLISAAFMSIPAGLFISKLIYPETEIPLQSIKDLKKENHEIESHTNFIEAIMSGALSGLKLAAAIGAILIAFVGLVALVNSILSSIGEYIFHYQNLTLQKILGIILSPIAYVLGVQPSEVFIAGSLIGEKTILNEFIAFSHLSPLIPTLSEKTVAILAFTLCGFANIGTLGIIIGTVQTLAPKRLKEASKLSSRALLAALLANLLSGALAGLMFDLQHLFN